MDDGGNWVRERNKKEGSQGMSLGNVRWICKEHGEEELGEER